jgi:tetratricopeptide (TPR) repeat protein/NAD-dependent SIR2 family protein deacetylase
METTIRRATVKQLAHKIKAVTNHPRFAFFLGAGASKQSGVITAGEMIRHFKERIITECCSEQLKTEEEKEKWFTKQDWYKKDGEYSALFAQFEPKELGRQRYIESIIEGQQPSFGYVVLANLMASNYINTIITTNFDDLVYSACTSYTGIRPIVYAYGVLASEMRVTVARPKILKLHGDFLYSTLKNTGREIKFQDPNMARQLAQVLTEYGLIVMGYSGGDKSVMKVLSSISPKNDLYWCVRKADEPNADVKKLLNDKGGYLVEIDGFDETMNEIRQIVGFDVSKMFGSIQERQDVMIEKIKDSALRYSLSDILTEIVEALQKQAEQEKEQLKKIQGLDSFTKALQAHEAGDPSKAEQLYRDAIRLNPSDAAAYNNLGNILAANSANHAEVEAVYRQAIKLDVNNAIAYTNLGLLLYRELARYDEAENVLREGLRLDPKFFGAYENLIMTLRLQNKEAEALPFAEMHLQLDPQNPGPHLSLAGLHKKLGHVRKTAEHIARARALIKRDDWYNLACLESIAGNTNAAIANLKHAAQTQENVFTSGWAKRDPDFEWIRQDRRFKAIVNRRKKKRSPSKSKRRKPVAVSSKKRPSKKS